MINFTVGPVQLSNTIRMIGYEQIPYFRTNEFSTLMLENEQLLLKFSAAPCDSKVVFLTGSGTASMEAAISNTLNKNDKVIVVNGGSFGQRFVDLLKFYEIPYSEILLPTGKQITDEILKAYDEQDYTAFVVNMHETSTGVRYDRDIISQFCKKNRLFLLVDSISSFLADEFNMKELGVDVMLTCSQKALACPPGISIMILSPSAIKRVKNSETRCMYLDLKLALKNMERGQTPFTPAVGILRQIHARFLEIEKNGGVAKEIHKTEKLATYFRNAIKALPFEFVSESMSNAVTALHPISASAYDIFTILKDEYDIWVCPNGGSLRDKIFRVGHIGFLTKEDHDKLIEALKDLQKRGII